MQRQQLQSWRLGQNGAHVFPKVQNGGIATESDYPYASGSGTAPACDQSSAKKEANFSDFVFLDRHNETKVLSALQNEGPVSIVLEATPMWQHYAGGIVDQSTCGASSSGVDHAVLAVGYGTDSENGNQSYWIVKNSWGPSW